MDSALVTFSYHYVIATLSFSISHTLPFIKGMETFFALNLKGEGWYFKISCLDEQLINSS